MGNKCGEPCNGTSLLPWERFQTMAQVGGIHAKPRGQTLWAEEMAGTPKWLEFTEENTGIPCFSKICFMRLHFYKRPTLGHVFAIWKKSKEDFCFSKKAKSKTSVQGLSCKEPFLRQQQWHCQAPSSGTTLSISASSTIALNCVLNVCFIPVLCTHYQDVYYGNCFFTLHHLGLRKLS